MTPLLARIETLIDEWDGWSETDLVLYSTLRMLTIVKPIALGPKARAFAEKTAIHGGVPLLYDQAI